MTMIPISFVNLVQNFLVANYYPSMGICGKIFNNFVVKMSAGSITIWKWFVVNLMPIFRMSNLPCTKGKPPH